MNPLNLIRESRARFVDFDHIARRATLLTTKPIKHPFVGARDNFLASGKPQPGGPGVLVLQGCS
jgi:hypothetical protein